MNPFLPAFRGRPLEMLYHIGDVHTGAIDSRFGESLVQQFSGGPYAWSPGSILEVSGLLSHEHDGGIGTSFPKNGLCGCFPKVASFARGSCLAEAGKRGSVCLLRLRGAIARRHARGTAFVFECVSHGFDKKSPC